MCIRLRFGDGKCIISAEITHFPSRNRSLIHRGAYRYCKYASSGRGGKTGRGDAHSPKSRRRFPRKQNPVGGVETGRGGAHQPSSEHRSPRYTGNHCIQVVKTGRGGPHSPKPRRRSPRKQKPVGGVETGRGGAEIGISRIFPENILVGPTRSGDVTVLECRWDRDVN